MRPVRLLDQTKGYTLDLNPKPQSCSIWVPDVGLLSQKQQLPEGPAMAEHTL